MNASSSIHPYYTARASHQVGQAVWHFISSGLRTVDGQPRVSVFPLELLWSTRWAESAFGGRLDGSLPESTSGPDFDRALRAAHLTVLEAFLGGGFWGSMRLVPPPILGLRFDGVTEVSILREFAASHGLRSLARMPTDRLRSSDPLAFAHAMSKYNQVRMEQRIILLCHMASQLRGCSSELALTEAEAAFRASFDHLCAQRLVFQSRVRDMAVLLGGKALDEVTEDIKSNFGAGQSVIELTTVDGLVPTYWETSEELALREAIQAA